MEIFFFFCVVCFLCVFLFFLVSLVFLFFFVSLVFLVPVLCSSVPLQPSPNKRAQAPADSIEFLWDQKKHLQGTGASIFLKSIIFLFLSSLWTGISLEIAVLHTPQQSFLKI